MQKNKWSNLRNNLLINVGNYTIHLTLKTTVFEEDDLNNRIRSIAICLQSRTMIGAPAFSCQSSFRVVFTFHNQLLAHELLQKVLTKFLDTFSRNK